MKNTLIIKRLERFVNKLSLKVVRLGPIDCITYLKMMKIIFDHKNNVFCRASGGEYFEKELIHWDEKRMKYRQNTEDDILFDRPVRSLFPMFLKSRGMLPVKYCYSIFYKMYHKSYSFMHH